MQSTVLQGCEDCADVIQQYPRFAGVVSVVVGGVTYAAIAVLMRGSVDPVAVGVFAVIFGVCYTGARYALSR